MFHPDDMIFRLDVNNQFVHSNFEPLLSVGLKQSYIKLLSKYTSEDKTSDTVELLLELPKDEKY